MRVRVLLHLSTDVHFFHFFFSVVRVTQTLLSSLGRARTGQEHTIFGTSESFEFRGLLPRALTLLFSEIELRGETTFNLNISCVEVYNNKLHDLLAPFASRARDLPISDDGEAVTVKGLTLRAVQTEADALAVMFAATTARKETRRDESRSHCIFTINITTHSLTHETTRRTVSKLTFVDLAGSSRIDPHGNRGGGGATDAEIRHINLSLSCLERVIVSATSNLQTFLPYRQSKLTHFLRDSLGHNSATTMIATISSDAALAEQTLATLRLAQRMRGVTAVTEPMVEVTAADTIQLLQNEIAVLQQELTMRDALDRRKVNTPVIPLTPLQRNEISILAKRFADREIDQIPITGVRQVDGLFAAFRNMLDAKGGTRGDSAALAQETNNMSSKKSHHIADVAGLFTSKSGRGGRTVASLVGKLTGGGVSTGTADADGPKMCTKGLKKTKTTRREAVVEAAEHELYLHALGVLTDALRKGEAEIPATIDAATKAQKDVMIRAEDIGRAAIEVFGCDADKGGTLAEKTRALATEGFAAVRLGDLGTKLGPRKKPATDISGVHRDEMYELFKRTTGKKYASILDGNNKALHTHRVTSRSLAIRLNTLKSGIDRVGQEKMQVESYFADGSAQAGGGAGAMMDEPGLKLHEEMVTLKQQYRDAHNSYSEHQREITIIEEKNGNCRRQMLRGFDEWFKNEREQEGVISPPVSTKRTATPPNAVLFETVRLQVRRAAASPSTRRVPPSESRRLDWVTSVQIGMNDTPTKQLPKLAFT